MKIQPLMIVNGDNMGMFDFFSKTDKERPVETVVNTIVIQQDDYGTSGTEVFAGYYDEEYLDKIRGKHGAKIFDMMRRSSTQIKMLLSAVKNPIRTAPGEIIAAGVDNPEYKKHAELCRQVMFIDIKFNKFLNESLTLAEFGHAVFEKVHKINIEKPIFDDEDNLVLNSYIGLKKLAWRSPKTIETWNFIDKEFASITQQADGDLDSYVTMEEKHLIIMAIDQEGDNLEGISLLRPCYGAYFRQNNYLKQNAAGIEKSMPIPTAKIPVGQESGTQYENMINSLKRFTSHQCNYLTYPEGWEIDLTTSTAYDPQKVEGSIDNEDKRMAKAFIANFLELGMSDGGGAYALSNDLSDFFLAGLVYIANVIKEEIDELLKELVILNFGEQDKYPTFEFSGIRDKAGKEFAEMIKLLIDGKVIVPDDELEKHTRKRIGVTPISEEGQRKVEEPGMVPTDPGMTLAEKVSFAIKNKRKVLGVE